MNTGAIFDLWREAFSVVVEVSAPFLITGLAVGLVIAILQTATQLQESILSFVPKLAAALLVLALGGNWILDRLGKFTTTAFTIQNDTKQGELPTPL